MISNWNPDKDPPPERLVMTDATYSELKKKANDLDMAIITAYPISTFETEDQCKAFCVLCPQRCLYLSF